MRMWMVDPRGMCRKHLLGEHVELHMTKSVLERGTSIKGYLDNNLLEPDSIIQRHQELETEIKKRGYQHKSPLTCVKITAGKGFRINRERALDDLLERCEECRKLHALL